MLKEKTGNSVEGPPNADISASFGTAYISSTMPKHAIAQGKLEGADGYTDMRLAPALFFLDINGERVITAGNCKIMTSESGLTEFTAVVVDAWMIKRVSNDKKSKAFKSSSQSRENCAQGYEFISVDEATSESRDGVLAEVEKVLAGILELCSQENHRDRAPEVAKRLSELSRNNVANIRDLRYGLESDLAKSSRDSSATEDYTSMVANLLQLNVICGRAADQAREAVREGLWVHGSDSEAYHAYRKLQDPSIVNPIEPATHEMRSWMRVHDAAIRQCQQMQFQLEAESTSIHALLASASSISSSREADAQTRFNLLVGLLSIGLGIPALFLALYSATILLPLNSGSKLISFFPVAAPLLFAALFALLRPPAGSTRKYWIGCGIVTLVVFCILIYVAIVTPLSGQ